MRLNKSLVTNLLAAALVVVGYLMNSAIVLNVGLFALSGAITNWVAVYMLFEKVPDSTVRELCLLVLKSLRRVLLI